MTPGDFGECAMAYWANARRRVLDGNHTSG